jgi:hypothetical protein
MRGGGGEEDLEKSAQAEDLLFFERAASHVLAKGVCWQKVTPPSKLPIKRDCTICTFVLIPTI